MKKLITALVIILVVVLVVSLAKDTIIKIGVEKGTKAVTGLKLSIQSLRVGILKTLVGIKDLKLYNPKGFEDKVMLDMPEIYVDYNLPDIIKGKIHLNEMRINLKEFVVVKNADGELNLDSLKTVKEQKEPAPAKPKKEGKAPEIQIDKLQLKVGKVIYKDYSKGTPPQVQEFDLNLDENYANINDPNKLVSLIVVKALANTTIARLSGFDMGALQGQLGGIQESIAETTKSLEETAKGLAESFDIPFGSKGK